MATTTGSRSYRVNALYPVGFAKPVPPAGIKGKPGEGVAGCLRRDDSYKGQEAQWRHRQHYLGEPGEPLSQTGVVRETFADNLVFGKPTGNPECTAAECLQPSRLVRSAAGMKVLQAGEQDYHSSKHQLGKVPVGVAQIPAELMQRGFGVQTRYGESAGSVIQNVDFDTPASGSHEPSRQVTRNYDWHGRGPEERVFGIQCPGDIDHVGPIMKWDDATSCVELPVDRHNFGTSLGVDRPAQERTLRSEQLRNTTDPSQRPPAGISTRAPEGIGATIYGMGTMRAVEVDTVTRPKPWSAADHMVHGIRTPPNPFKSPLCGPGKYADLHLADEDFIKLRDRGEVVEVFVRAFRLDRAYAEAVFDSAAASVGRDQLSIGEYHAALKAAS